MCQSNGITTAIWILDADWTMACQWASVSVAGCFRLRGDLRFTWQSWNARGRWRNSVLMQLCIQVKRRTIPDRFHTTVPSAFEFPASRKTLHELESSSLEVMIGMGGTDWMTNSNVILRKFWKETIPWSPSLTASMESVWRDTGSLLRDGPSDRKNQDGNVSLSC